MPAHQLLSTALLLVAAAGALSILIVQGITGVPPMSSSAREAADVVMLLRRAGLPGKPVIYELGSGWGSLVVALARAFPDAEVRGVEMSPLPYWVSRLRTWRLANVTLARGDFFKTDLSGADAVTCYLMTRTMPRLASLLDRSLRPGTPVVALSFWFRERQASDSSTGAGLLGATALYHWPARKPVPCSAPSDADSRST